MAQKLLLIDASNSIYRAFFALPALAKARASDTRRSASTIWQLLRESPAVVARWGCPAARAIV
jgi:5'-3' exonuclease